MSIIGAILNTISKFFMKKKITHFCDKCIGCGACVGIAPEIFEYDQTAGKSHLIDSAEEKTAEGERVCVKTVAVEKLDDGTAELLSGSCCVQAINIENIEDDTEKERA